MTAYIDAADLARTIAEISIYHAVDHIQAGLMNGQNVGRQHRHRTAVLAQIEFVEPGTERLNTFADFGSSCRHQATLSSHAPGQYVTFAESPTGCSLRNSGCRAANSSAAASGLSVTHSG